MMRWTGTSRQSVSVHPSNLSQVKGSQATLRLAHVQGLSLSRARFFALEARVESI